jgi:site-specific DNA recombinase
MKTSIDKNILANLASLATVYPEKMTFDGFAVRTNRINEAVRLIYCVGAGYSENKNRTNQNNSSLSRQVLSCGHISV